MITKPIPSSGEPLPVIGLGTWQTFDVGSSSSARAQLEEVLRTFADLGGKLIDSSPMYGTSEEVVGDLAAKLGLHSKLFIATKVWTSGREAGIQQMEDSFRKLRAKRIDLMQVHNLVDVEAHMPRLQEWKKAGRIRYTGITHWTAKGARRGGDCQSPKDRNFHFPLRRREPPGRLARRRAPCRGRWCSRDPVPQRRLTGSA